jgi:methylglutaconyl-CoA hydratase
MILHGPGGPMPPQPRFPAIMPRHRSTAVNEPLVKVEQDGPAVSILTLNRPEKRNALSIALVDAICQAVAGVEADAGRRVLIVRGAGPVFCAGLDMAEALDPAKEEKTAEQVARLFHTISQSRLVTICAVHGAAAAGGAGFMAAHDLVVAGEGTKIGYPEMLRGLVPALLMTFMMRQLNDRHARELLLLGEYIDARRALEMALVNRVVPAERLMDECLSMARTALLGGPKALAATKRLIEQMSIRNAVADLKDALEHHKHARRSDEAREGLRAFVEKRKPQWQEQA